jgi:hypothetical protein
MFRRLFLALTVLAVALAPIVVAAQGSQPPHGTQSPPPQVPPPGGPMHGGDMHGGGGMMMCPMMGMMGGSMMGGGSTPMMGMMGGRQDPKMMQMHGEMMKTMGEIMMKHGKALEGGRQP